MLTWFLDLDDRLFVAINQTWASAFLDPIMKLLSSSLTFIPFYIWGIYRLIKRFQKSAIVPILLAVLAFALADSISSKVLKPSFKRVRPAFETHLTPRTPAGMPGGKYGFVSSHAANAFALYPLLVAMIFYKKDLRFSQNSAQRMSVFMAFFVAFWIAYSRVYLGRHYVGDVFFGGLLGMLIAYGLWRFYRKWAAEKEGPTADLA